MPSESAAAARDLRDYPIPQCVCMSSGEILLVSPADGTVTCAHEVGSPILGAAWSPEGDAVAIVTAAAPGSESLLLVSSVFDELSAEPLHQFPGTALSDRSLAPSQPGASLDWGKDKALAGRAPRVLLSWRADGRFVASNSAGGLDGTQRRIR